MKEVAGGIVYSKWYEMRICTKTGYCFIPFIHRFIPKVV
jgi:hypothetical protein